jgi:hypothetical protein
MTTVNDITLIDLVAERIGGQVAALTGSIEFIAELQALMEQDALPQRDVGAFVVPLGFDDRGGESGVGMHTQMLADAIGVVLYVKSRGDLKAKKALPRIEPLIDAVIAAVAGWTPGNTSGVFQVKRGRLMPGGKGIVIYTIDFELLDQLRIAT